MNRFIQNFIKNWKAYILTGIISAIIGVIIFLLFFFIKESALNGCTIAFIVNVSIGGFIFVGSLGMFDTLSYGFKQAFTAAFAKKANKYNDYPGYLQEQNVKRKHSPHIYIPFLLVGAIFAVATFIIYTQLY